MAVPTITAITPSSGTTTGRAIIVIEGTNFRLPSEPPDGYLGGDEVQSVSVAVGSMRAEWAAAVTDEKLHFELPAWDGPSDVLPITLDVRVANLDDNGDEIAGENVTLTDGFTVDRISLVKEGTVRSALRALIEHLRRHVVQNVRLATSRDYTDTGIDSDRLQAELPCLLLINPVTRYDGRFGNGRPAPVDGPNDTYAVTSNRTPVMMMIGFEALAGNDQHIMGLHNAIMSAATDVPEITVGDQTVEWTLPIDRDIDLVMDPNKSDLYRVSGEIRIQNLQIDPANGRVDEKGWSLYADDGLPTLDVSIK